MTKTKKVCLIFTIIWSLFIVISMFPFGIWLFLFSYDLNTVNYYNDESNYITFDCAVENFSIEDDYVYITFAHSQKEFYTRFCINGKNVDLAINNGLTDILQKDAILTITSAPGYFGDGWSYPIVEIDHNGNTILPYEIGKTNNLEVQQEAENFAKLYITVLGCIVGVLIVFDVCSIVGLCLQRNKSSK